MAAFHRDRCHSLQPRKDNLMTLHRATPRKHVEWSLLIDALVEIRHHGKAIRTGFVEDAMPDSSALWLAADATHPRRMFEAARGHQVWVIPQELSGSLNYRMTATQMFGHSSRRELSQPAQRSSAAPACWDHQS